MSVARFVTDWADEAVVLPLAAVVALLFLLLRWRRGAVAWVAAVGGTLFVMLGLKLVAVACARCLFGPGLASPSGHTAAGAAVYGGLLVVGLRRGGMMPLACAGGVAALVGWSRLALGVHELWEVVVGGVVGTAGGVLFARMAGAPGMALRAWHLMVAAGAAGLVLHGAHLPAEASIRDASFGLWPACRGCR